MWPVAVLDGKDLPAILTAAAALVAPILAFMMKRGNTDPVVRALRRQTRDQRRMIGRLIREAAERESEWEAERRQTQQRIARLEQRVAELEGLRSRSP